MSVTTDTTQFPKPVHALPNLSSDNCGLFDHEAFEKLSAVLHASGQGCRFRVGNEWLDIGCVHEQKIRPVEFVFNDFKTALSLAKRPRLQKFAQAYFAEELNISCSMLKAIEILHAFNLAFDKPRTIVEAAREALSRFVKVLTPVRWMKFESLDHYTNSGSAYRLILDRNMQYTCGVFENGSINLDESQIVKFELIVKLAGLKSNFSHLDVGCGWGGMIRYFEDKYLSRSVGITNTPDQREYASKEFGVDALLGDFQSVELNKEKFDLITIVGMIEHLTPYRQNKLLIFAKHHLKPGGKIYLQCITRPYSWIGGDAHRIIAKDIFPGHHLRYRHQHEKTFTNLGLRLAATPLEHSYHYGLTTKAWARNVEKNETQLIDIMGVRNYRIYLAYLSYASKMFLDGRGSLMRYVLSDNNS